jgi:hypothetical protein
MSVLKYKDPVTGEVKTVGSPSVDVYSKAETDEKFAPAYTYGTTDLTEGTSPLETGKLYFVYE